MVVSEFVVKKNPEYTHGKWICLCGDVPCHRIADKDGGGPVRARWLPAGRRPNWWLTLPLPRSRGPRLPHSWSSACLHPEYPPFLRSPPPLTTSIAIASQAGDGRLPARPAPAADDDDEHPIRQVPRPLLPLPFLLCGRRCSRAKNSVDLFVCFI